MFPDNLNYSDLVTEYKKYEINADFLMFANNDVLRLIAKFDSTNNPKYLNAAKELIDKICYYFQLVIKVFFMKTQLWYTNTYFFKICFIIINKTN